MEHKPIPKRWNIIDLFDYCYRYKNNTITVVNNDETESEVGEFRYLTFLWCENGMNFNNINPANYVLSANAFLQLLRTKFYDFDFLTSFVYNPETGKREYIDTIDQAANSLIDTINVWKHDKLPAFRKLLEALRAEYNPISNYDKTSVIETSYTGKEKTEFTPTGTETDTLTKTGTETDTITKTGTESKTFEKGPEHREHKKTTYDSDSSYLTDEDSLTGVNGVAYTDTETDSFTNRSDTDTRSFTNRSDTNTRSFTNRKDTNERSFTDRKDTVTERTSGNIGTMTTQSMILSQYGITDADSIEYYCVADFARSCLIQ